MKKIMLASAIFILTLFQFVNGQIVNTFPLNDSVGIGTDDPVRILDVRGPIIVNEISIGDNVEGGNFVFGSEALNFNTTGSSNIAIGNLPLVNNTTGSDNVAIGGIYTLRLNETGFGNIALGSRALTNNISGYNNIVIGVNAMYDNQSGFSNVAIGSSSMNDNFKGDNCTAVGAGSLVANTKGDYNTAIGRDALNFNKSGNYNTTLGYDADVSAINLTNATAIGNSALVDASNKVRIGNASVTSNGGQVSWTAYSDARIKTKVKENVPGLEFINLLKPVTYHFDVDKQNEIMGVYINEKVEGMYDIEKITFTGFLAQDVETAAKKINYDFSGLDKSGEILGLRYAEFVVPLVKAVQELSGQNEELMVENANMLNEISTLESRITQLEKLISKQGIVLNDATTEEIYKQSATIESEAYTATLAQNVPNPFAGTTSIAYYVPETAQQAHIKIANATGASLFMAEVRLGNGVLEVDATQLAAGTYSYTLLVDSKVVDTKLMVIQK